MVVNANTIMRINFMMLVVLSQVLITVRMNTASFTFIKIILTSSLFSLLLLEEVVQMTLVPQVNCPPERKIHSAQHKKRNNKQTTFRSAQKRNNKKTTLSSAQKRKNKQTTLSSAQQKEQQTNN